MRRFCPVCESSKISRKNTLNEYDLQRCQDCTFEFITNPKSVDSELNIYNEGYYKGKLTGARGYANYSLLETQLIKESLKKIEIIRKYSSLKKLLDIGAGTGIFLIQSRKKGFIVEGNDISVYASEKLRKKKIKCYSGSIEENILPSGRFEIITAWDVIEHISKPHKAIESIKKALKSGGWLFITTPSTDRFDARLLGKYWYGYKKIPEHISFFNSQSITELLVRHDFEVIKISNWGFYRDLEFILTKLEIYSTVFGLIKKILRFFGLISLSFFIPLTDSMVIARRK